MSRFNATITPQRWHGDQAAAGEGLARTLCSRRGARIEAHEAHGVRRWAGREIGRDRNAARVIGGM